MDGRHARSARTRAAVAEAMLDCLEEGILRPSAKQVSERAGVSTRAVFRHFDNMEALTEEVAEIQIERVMSELPPIEGEGSLEVRIGSLVQYVARCNEIVTPVRRAALLREPFSTVIRERMRWMRSTLRRQVRKTLADELARLTESERRERVASIAALLSFGYWDELRRYENLSTPAATRVLKDALHALLRS